LENHRDFYYGDGFGVNPVLKYDLGDGSTLDLSYEYLDQERFIDRGIPTGDDKRPAESLKDIVFGDATENFSTHEAHIFRAIFEHDVADSLKGRLSASHSSHDKLYQNLYVADGKYDASANTVLLDGYRDTTKRSSGILSYDVSGEVETGGIVHNIVAGIQYLDMDNDNDRYNASFHPNNNSDDDTAIFNIARPIDISGGYGNDTTGSTYNRGYEGSESKLNDRTFADVNVFSFYINDEISLMDSLTLLLGVRFDDMKFDVVDAKTPAKSGKDRDFTTSPRVGLTFDVTNEAMIYAAYSEAFAPKSGDQYAKLANDTSRLDPDSFENLEFGVKYDLPMGLTLSAAYFEVEANKPDYDTSTMTSSMIKSEVTGFEISLVGSLTDKWFLSAGYTDLDASDQNGNRLREAPESAFSIWNNYLVSDRLAVNFGIIYQDESLMKNPKSDGTTYAETLPDYTRVDVGASYGLTENTRVRLHVENLFDEVYFPHSHSRDQASVGAPINATFGVTSSF
jgi:catecholate siderophore receptor